MAVCLCTHVPLLLALWGLEVWTLLLCASVQLVMVGAMAAWAPPPPVLRCTRLSTPSHLHLVGCPNPSPPPPLVGCPAVCMHMQAQLAMVGPVGDVTGAEAQQVLQEVARAHPGRVYAPPGRYFSGEEKELLLRAAEFCLVPSRWVRGWLRVWGGGMPPPPQKTLEEKEGGGLQR